MWKLPLKLWGRRKGGGVPDPPGSDLLLQPRSLLGRGGRAGQVGTQREEEGVKAPGGVTSLETERFILCMYMYIFSLIEV